ncbi:MAG: NAD-dependent epimerase/dehydratase family protein [Paracoccaceae bacterium]|nr:NAD-dependent epimerase/dehydratase family protein [Paracoccaceae bacterium]
MPLLVLGATGRVGQILRRQWPAGLGSGLRPIWQARAARPGFVSWDILKRPCPLLAGSGGVVLCLAGVTGGPGLTQNTALALAACAAARRIGARHVFIASSAAVYGPGLPMNLAEDAPLRPVNAYGVAKRAMEAAVGDQPGITMLRIGNIVGADALLGQALPDQPASGQVVLDPVPGQPGGPVRSYIGPVTLAAVLARLCGLAVRGEALPRALNIAAPPPVAMADLLTAAGIGWRFGPENPGVVARVGLDTRRLAGLVEIAPDAGQPGVMVAQWRGLLGGGR